MRWIAVLVGSTLLWPAAQLLAFVLRFGRLPPGGAREALVFVPMGFVAGTVATALLGVAATARRRRGVLTGYAAASPFAFVGSLLGGLVLPGAWGPLVFGAVPLALGCVVGFLVTGSSGGPGAERGDKPPATVDSGRPHDAAASRQRRS